MRRVLALVWRFAVIVGGFIAATIAGGLFIVLLMAAADAQMMRATDFILATTVMTMLVAYSAFMPATVLILWGEWAGNRDWLFYALGSAGAAVLLCGITWGDRRPFGTDVAFMLTMVGTGLVGGFAYWVVAGRRAGLWRVAPTASAPSGS